LPLLLVRSERLRSGQPFNHPLLIAVKKIAPALAAGNSLLVKPSELAPVTVLEFAEMAIEAGLPPDVLQVIPGEGRTIVPHLLENSLVKKVDITVNICRLPMVFRTHLPTGRNIYWPRNWRRGWAQSCTLHCRAWRKSASARLRGCRPGSCGERGCVRLVYCEWSNLRLGYVCGHLPASRNRLNTSPQEQGSSYTSQFTTSFWQNSSQKSRASRA
jgi:hypothetical protein